MEWAFDVLDRLTAPMKAMESQAKVFDETLGNTTKELERLEKQEKLLAIGLEKDPLKKQIMSLKLYKSELEKMRPAHQETAESTSMLGQLLEADFWVEAAHKVEELTEKVIDLGVELFKMGIEASDANKTQVAGLSIMLGNKDAAEEMKETLDQMSKSSGIAEGVLFQQFQQLAPFTKQFGKKASEDVIAAVADVQLGFGQGASQAVLNVIQGSVSMGGLNDRLLRQLKETGVTTIPEFEAALAKARGVTLKQARGLIKAGKVTPADTANLILDLVQKNVDGGKGLGARSAELASTTVGGALNKLKVQWDQLLEGQAMQPAINALKKVSELLDPATERGKKFQEVLGKIFDGFGKLIDFVASGDRLGKIFDTISTAAGYVWPILKGIGYTLAAIGVAVGIAMAPIILLSGAFYAVGVGVMYAIGKFGEIWEWFKTIPARAEAAGKSLIDGLVNGITGGLGRVVGAVENVGSSMIDSIRKKLGIHSPSTVMFELGGFMSEGMSLGVQSKAPKVQSSIGAMIDIAIPQPKFAGMNDIMLPQPKFAGPIGGGGGGGRSIQISVDSKVDGGAHHADLATEIAEAITTKVRAEIVRFMESDSIEN